MHQANAGELRPTPETSPGAQPHARDFLSGHRPAPTGSESADRSSPRLPSEALSRPREAAAALRGDDLPQAAKLLDQAAREMMDGARMAKPEQITGEKNKRDFEARFELAQRHHIGPV